MSKLSASVRSIDACSCSMAARSIALTRGNHTRHCRCSTAARTVRCRTDWNISCHICVRPTANSAAQNRLSRPPRPTLRATCGPTIDADPSTGSAAPTTSSLAEVEITPRITTESRVGASSEIGIGWKTHLPSLGPTYVRPLWVRCGNRAEPLPRPLIPQ